MNYNWNWHIFFEPSPTGQGTYLDMLLSGVKWTLLTSLLAWSIALALGSLIGVMRTLPSPLANRIGTIYVEIFRNIPILVQLFLWFFVIPELLPRAAGTWLKTMHNAAFWTAGIGIGIYMAARVAEQVRAGINTLPRGQNMAGKALGMTTFQTYWYVLLPMTYRIILPPLSSEFLNTIKNTAVALSIGLLELTGAARSMQEFSFQVFESFTGAVVFYLAINAVVIYGMRYLEKRTRIPGLQVGK